MQIYRIADRPKRETNKLSEICDSNSGDDLSEKKKYGSKGRGKVEILIKLHFLVTYQ